MKEFIERFTKRFQLSSHSRAAVIQYSNYGVTTINFNDYKSNEDFNAAVKRLPYRGGNRRIDRALTKAREDLFGPAGSARQGVKRLAIILTGGKQSHLDDKFTLDRTANSLRNRGVNIYAIGVGQGLDKNYLKAIANQNVILATSFNELLNKVGSIVKRTCEGINRMT